MALKTANNATTQLTASISAGQTTLPVLNTVRFPTLTGTDYCYATLVSLTGGVDNYGNPNVFEIVRVNGPFTPGGTLLTVVRGQDGTSGTAFAVGDVVDLRINRQTLIDSASVGGALLASNNLSDVANVATSRTNLGLGAAATQPLSAFLQPANNLSDVSVVATARTNLGLGSAALLTTAQVLQPSNNLSDVANAATSRTNLGLGAAATQALSAFLQPANNLSDVSNVTTARSNLGLSSLAILTPPGNTTTFLRGDGTFSATLTGALTAAGATLTGNLDMSANVQITSLRRITWAYTDDGSSGSSKTIDFSGYLKHKLQATGNCTLSFTAPGTDGEYVLVVQGDGTQRTFTWPGTVIWEGGNTPVMPTTTAHYLEVRGRYNGANYLQTFGQFGY